ncbi:MAG: thermonuclease family protein [Symploca sp. SIO2B6]|nr:thermonuclease family protein [Symploca sp. SIO2B6]
MRIRKLFYIVCCCLILLAGCQSEHLPKGITLKVQRVVSGQTLEVLNPKQVPPLIEPVRLIGIEAPDLRQKPWGLAAKKRLEKLISEVSDGQSVLKTVLFEPDIQKQDSFGRSLAYAWYNGKLLNEQLVKEGYALAAPRIPNNKYDTRLIKAQEYARIMGYGIWNPEQPMRLSPSEFRRQHH